MKKEGGKLKNWQIIGDQLYGDIYGDSRFKDGEGIRSSLIEKITVETRNTIYVLHPVEQSNGKRFSGKEA